MRLSRTHLSKHLVLVSVVVVFLSLALHLIGLQLVPTTVFSTTNGLWKVIEAERWLAGEGQPNYANLLFIAVLAIITDQAHMWDLPPTDLLVYWNALSIALAAGIVTVAVGLIVGQISIAGVSGVAFAMSGGALTHSLGSEDIAGALPIISLLVLVFIVWRQSWLSTTPSLLLGMGAALLHLWEWRAALPIYVALFLLLAYSTSHQSFRLVASSILRMALAWSLTLFSLAIAVVWWFRLSIPQGFGLQGIGSAAAQLVFPGKGIGSVWGGFSNEKLYFQIIGLSEALLGGRNIQSFDADVSRIAVVSIVYGLSAFGIYSLARSNTFRPVSFFVMAVLLAAGLLNLFSQPQDPQMQVTQLPLVFIVAAYGLAKIIIAVAGRIESLPSSTIIVILGLAFSVVSVSSFQNGSSFWLGQSLSDKERIERAINYSAMLESSNAVPIGLGWENEVTFLAYVEGGLNNVGHNGWSNEKRNVLFAVDFISANPDDTAENWFCAAAELSVERPGQLFISIAEETPTFASLTTIIDPERVVRYEELWLKGFQAVGTLVTLDLEFARQLCPALEGAAKSQSS